MFSAAGISAKRSTTLYAEDVFSATAYTGNGGAQSFTSGPDLLGKGGLVWIKARGTTADNILIDTVRGANYATTDTTAAQVASAFNVGYLANGFSVNTANTAVNANGTSYVGWQFRKAPKFFDVVTWTGNGSADRSIPHGLGISPGMVIAKAVSTTGDWIVGHQALLASAPQTIKLNTTAASVVTSAPAGINFDATNISVHQTGADPYVLNATGVSYVAYVFAHDTTADGLIQCGSYTGTGFATQTITLGWEPQFLLVKPASVVGAWSVIDSSRGFGALGTDDAVLSPGTSAAELGLAKNVSPTATGFQIETNASAFNTSGATYVYMAIRRPGKVPSSAAQVYNAIARTGTGVAVKVTGVGFAPDMAIIKNRTSVDAFRLFDKMRGSGNFLAVDTTAESSTSSFTSFNTDGVSLGTLGATNASGAAFINYFFRRCPKVFEIVNWTGDGTGSGREIPHNLKVRPELSIVKVRSTTGNWQVATELTGMLLNTTSAQVGGGGFRGSSTDSFVRPIDIGVDAIPNASGATYIAYLFASLAGVSKVFSYTGDGASQAINCGFAAGARFVMIKRNDVVGDWFVFDTARGIVAGNDPHLSVNTTAAEVATDDSIDPDSSGFIVNQLAATNLNVTGATYIGLAIA